jgi:DNA invertase Pin-like site-specific DNA recombinase
MRVGSLQVSRETEPQTTDVPRHALLATGVDPRHLWTDQASDARDHRPGLPQALASVQPGDGLLVRTLDRLGRARPHRLSTVLPSLHRTVIVAAYGFPGTIST